ncbi:MAG: hypothetical protein PUC12_09965 [Clostridiales bacterium]|nr:hypothetical protein [Clostridiales bacterium]
MYEAMFYIGLVLFIIGFIVSVILFIRNDVAKIIGDLTGYNARKAVEKIQREREGKKQPAGEDLSEVGKKNNRRKLRKDEKTDVLPLVSNTEKAETLSADLKNTKSSKKVEDMETAGFEGVFETEEDVTVFGGEVVTHMPTTVLSEESSSQDVSVKPEEIPELSKASTKVLKENNSGVHILPNGINALASDEELAKMLAEEENGILTEEETGILTEETGILTEEGTDILVGEETDILAGEETEMSDSDAATDLLYDESMEKTTLLTENDETDVLIGNEMTSVLESGK